jgi:PAS domain S-box-containing protein
MTVVELPEGARMLAAVRDITERRRAESALRRSEERYALAARATSNAIWDWDLTTGSLTWNEGVHEVYGYAPGTVADGIQWWYDAIHPDDRERVVAGIHAVIDGADGGQAWRDEYRFARGDGTYAVAVDRGYVARDAAGRATRMIGAMTDVTAERLAREAAGRGARGARVQRGAAARGVRAGARRHRRDGGPEHVYAIVSPRYADSPGAGRPLLGRTVREAFPEIEGTGYFETLDHVYRRASRSSPPSGACSSTAAGRRSKSATSTSATSRCATRRGASTRWRAPRTT